MLRVAWFARCGVAMLVFLFFLSPSPFTSKENAMRERESEWVVREEGERKLLGIQDPTSHCVNGTLSSSFTEKYGMFLFPLLCVYICIGLAIICEGGFQDSLYCISAALNLSPDVAGATFMAGGTSAPELFISLLALTEPDDAMGMGTIVGSVVFNVLIICGLCAIFAPSLYPMKWRVIARDCFWNFVTFLYLLIAFWDEFITLPEAMFGLLIYVIYIIVMINSDRLVTAFAIPFSACGLSSQYNSFFGLDETPSLPLRTDDDGESYTRVTEQEDDYYPYTTQDEGGISMDDVAAHKRVSNSLFDSDDEELDYPSSSPSSSSSALSSSSHSEEEDDYHFHKGYLIFPESTLGRVEFILTLPFRAAFAISVPGVTQFGKYTFVMTFINCVIWLAILSYFLILWVSDFGCTIGLGTEAGNAIMGLTFLAVGTSMPDCLTSVFVARSGRLEMALCNALGSNIFDILIALSFPWTVKLLAASTNRMKVDNATLKRDIMIMFLVIIIFFVSLAAQKFYLTRMTGVLFAFIYSLFVIYSVLSELGVIGF